MIIELFIIIVGSHTLWTYAEVQNASQVIHIIVEKVNKLLVFLQMILKMIIENVTSYYLTQITLFDLSLKVNP